MGTPLFTLEDNFIESLCFGMDGGDTLNLFNEALEAGRQELLEQLMTKVESSALLAPYADQFDIEIEDGHYVIIVPEEIEPELFEQEYGDLDTPPQPILRPVVQQHSSDAARAITQALEMP